MVGGLSLNPVITLKFEIGVWEVTPLRLGPVYKPNGIFLVAHIATPTQNACHERQISIVLRDIHHRLAALYGRSQTSLQ
jgi:hypothetical protein